MSHFRDQGVHSLYGSTELQVVMFDTAGLLPFRWSKWQVQPATRATYRRHQKQQDWQLLGLWSISSAITSSRGDVLWRTRGRRGRQINRQLIQVYRRYQTAALSIQQAPNFLRRGWDPQSMPTDFTMTGLTGSSVWFSQILWLNNSVIHVLSALKAPIPSFKSLPFGQGTLFFSHAVPLPLFCCIQLFINPRRPRQLSHPLFSAHLLGLSFPFFPPAPCLAQGPYSQIGLHWRDKCSANALKHVQ